MLDEQSNSGVEQLLNLIHTSESMKRAKDSISSFPPGAGEDFCYDSENGDDDFDDDEESTSSEGGEAGPSTIGSFPSWVYQTKIHKRALNSKIVNQYIKIAVKAPSLNSTNNLVFSLH